MIPILYDTNETAFISNGLGRLRDCLTCVVTEERNGVYECDFEYPMDGANFDKIQVGRIIGITHDESGDIEPFDIVSYTRPIDGVVTFHCTHISYRLCYMTVTGSKINSLADAFTAFASAQPSMPFSFDTDKTSTGFVAAFDGKPKTVRSIMGGTEGSLLDAYGGEYSFNNWSVYLHSARGQMRNFSIRYGVNMLDYNEEYDSQGTYSSCVPYWTDGTNIVIGDRVDSDGTTVTGRGECVPLDLSDKFDSQPTKAQVEAEAQSYMSNNNTFYPAQNIKVDFVRLQDMGYENLGSLMQCNLCDTIKVIFPDYNASGTYKIVKTVWNVLENRYEEMELGELSTTLAEALGISSGGSSGDGSDPVIESGIDANNWTYKKYASGRLEADRVWNVGQYTISTVESSPIRVGSTLTITAPSLMTSGSFTAVLMGNSSNSACFLEHIANNTIRIAKAVTTNVTLQNMTIGLTLINGRWK